ncbi:MAG: hypothetical protein ACTHJ0_13020 [Flavipsychrobacter sp.]
MAKRKKVITGLAIVLVIAGLVLGILTWISARYKRFIEGNIPVWVAKGTDSIYHATVQDISINIFTRRLTITGITLKADTNCMQYHRETGKHNRITVDLYVPKLQINNIVWAKLLTSKEFSCGSAYIWQPRVVITSRYHEVDSSKLQPEKKKSAEIKRLFASTIQIINPDISFKSFTKEKDSFICRLQGGKGILNEWLLDSEHEDTTRFLLARSCIIDSSAFLFHKPSMLYAFKTRSFYLNTAKEQLSLADVNIAPTMNNAAYYRIVGHRTTICHARISKVQLIDFKWQQLIHNEKLRSTIHLIHPYVSLYFSYLPPAHPTNAVKDDPSRIIRTASVQLDIPNIKVTDGYVLYTELNEESMQEGKLDLDKINVTLNNLANIDTVIRKNKLLVAKANAKVYRTGTISATVQLKLPDTTGAFDIQASIRNLHAGQINNVTRPLSLLQLDSMQLGEMNVNVTGNQSYTRSILNMRYTNLKLTMEKPVDGDKLKSKPLASAFANALFVYRDNPMPGGDTRTADTYTPRDITTPFMPTIVKNVRFGINKIIIRHEKIVSLVTNGKVQTDGKKKKKGLFSKLK